MLQKHTETSREVFNLQKQLIPTERAAPDSQLHLFWGAQTSSDAGLFCWVSIAFLDMLILGFSMSDNDLCWVFPRIYAGFSGIYVWSIIFSWDLCWVFPRPGPAESQVMVIGILGFIALLESSDVQLMLLIDKNTCYSRCWWSQRWLFLFANIFCSHICRIGDKSSIPYT